MRALATLIALVVLAGAGCGKRGGAPEPAARASDARGNAAAPDPATAAADPPAPATPADAADRERALAFLAALDRACEQGTPAPALPLMPSRFRALVPRQALIDGALDVVCVRNKLGLPEDEPAGLEEALGMAAHPFPADWIDQLERMCADPDFHYDHLSNLRFPKNRYFLVETPREDGMRALAAARCLARRILGDTPVEERTGDQDGLLFRLNNLHEGIKARYEL